MTETAAEPAIRGRPATTADAFLGGKVLIRQPETGYRAGIDAVLLAAACPAVEGKAARVLDLGAGAGTVGLSLAARIGDSRVTLLEREAELAALALENANQNGFGARVAVVCGDLSARDRDAAAPRLDADSFDHVLANPPFHVTGRGTAASGALKSASHAMPDGTLDHWVRYAARVAKPGGTLTIIHKAEALGEVLEAMARRFGAIKVFPLYPRTGEAAIRVLVEGEKGSRAPLTVLAGLVLHGSGHQFSEQATSILRNGAGLSLSQPLAK